MTDTLRDINGSVFASLFDDEMNDGAEAFAPQTQRSTALAFADKDRLLKFIKANSTIYKLVSTSGETVKVDSLEDGMRLVISPLKVNRVKGKQLSEIISAIEAKDEDASVMEIKSMPLKECLEIVNAIKSGDTETVRNLFEELLVDCINDRIDLEEANIKGNDVEELVERRFRIKVNAKGKRRRKLICRKGYKVGNGGRSCIRIKAAEKMKRRKGMRKALRTKKGKGAALLRRSLIKRRRAMRKRTSMGL